MFNIFKREKMVEVCRSFAYKLNMGNYESRDFFCSQKARIPEKEAEKTSELLHEFCKNAVIKSINNYKNKAKIQDKSEPVKKIKYQPLHEELHEKIKKIPNWQNANAKLKENE